MISITKFKIIPNPDKEVYLEITNDVLANNDYCPCMAVKNNDTKCICKTFREQEYEGECHCGRFIKIKI